MSGLIPEPLHPAVVHIPVALAVLLPLFVLGAIWLIRRGAPVRPAWAVAVALTALLAVSGLVAKQTGEQQEERVERVVPGRSMHTHEEAAELFVLTSFGVLAVALVGFTSGRIGRAGRIAAAIGTAAILGTGWNVGHTGGMLVYRDGAASAYASTGGANPSGASASDDNHEEGRRGSDDR